MRECGWFPLCPMKRYYDRGALEYRWIEEYCRGEWTRCARFRMEERGEYHPDCMLPDGSLDPGLESR